MVAPFFTDTWMNILTVSTRHSRLPAVGGWKRESGTAIIA